MGYVGTTPTAAPLTSSQLEDGLVTAAKLATDAVETAKVKDLNVTVAKLPATVDISSKTVTLPASVSGLGTGITNSQLAGSIDVTSKITGVVPAANLGSGTASASTYLAGNQTYQTITEYDDDALQNDIATLALHQATNANAAKYNLTNTNVDVYQDSTGVASFTDCARDTTGEYVSTIVPMSTGSLTNFVANNWDLGALSSQTVGDGTASHAASPDEDGMIVTNASATTPITFAANSAFEITATNSNGSGYGAFVCLYKTSLEPAGSPANDATWNFTGMKFLTDSFGLQMCSSYGNATFGTGGGATNFVSGDSDFDFQPGQFTISRDTGGVFRVYQGTTSGTLILTSTSTGGQNFSNTSEYALAWGGTGSNAAAAASFQYTPVTPESVNATGNYVSTATTANASVSKVGIVITYKNNAGTNTLNTDIVAQVSADGGSNYSTVTLAAAGTFSTGVLQCVANDVSVTAGTSIQYKISFANQSSGVKEARITGVSLIY